MRNMGHLLRLISLVCIGLQLALGQDEDWSEPKCYSRFDYDHKVLLKLVTLETKLDTLETTKNKLQDVVKQQRDTIDTLRSNLEATKASSDHVLMSLRDNVEQASASSDAAFKSMTDRVEQLSISVSAGGSGTTYTRWGRTDCPGNGTELVYDGYAGGSHYQNSGGAANYLCLPKDPIWGHFENRQLSSAFVYGSEYQYYSMDKFFGRNLINSDVPCAVCRTKRATTMMLPARNKCYDGWTLEYHGYLSAGYYGHKSATEYVCMDIEPEAIPDSQANKIGRLFYQTEAKCGSLKCPPYVEGRELTCAFCSK